MFKLYFLLKMPIFLLHLKLFTSTNDTTLRVSTSSKDSAAVSKEAIEKCIEALEDEGQKDFIRKCLIKDPELRPKARDLLFHQVKSSITFNNQFQDLKFT